MITLEILLGDGAAVLQLRLRTTVVAPLQVAMNRAMSQGSAA